MGDTKEIRTMSGGKGPNGEVDMKDVYDMDDDYNLLSWKIPSLDLTIKIGDKFTHEGKEKTLTKMMYADDMIGIYSMYPHLDDEFMTLYDFVDKINAKEITY